MPDIEVGDEVRWIEEPGAVGRVERVTRDGRNAFVATEAFGVKVGQWVSVRILELVPRDDIAGEASNGVRGLGKNDKEGDDET